MSLMNPCHILWKLLNDHLLRSLYQSRNIKQVTLPFTLKGILVSLGQNFLNVPRINWRWWKLVNFDGTKTKASKSRIFFCIVTLFSYFLRVQSKGIEGLINMLVRTQRLVNKSKQKKVVDLPIRYSKQNRCRALLLMRFS